MIFRRLALFQFLLCATVSARLHDGRALQNNKNKNNKNKNNEDDEKPKPENEVECQYIVEFADKKGKSLPEKASDIAKANRAKKGEDFALINGFHVLDLCDEKDKRKMEKDKRVKRMSPVVTMEKVAVASWGLDRIDQVDLPLDDTYNPSGDGTGVTAYIIDTGINENHADFGGRASIGTDTINDGQNGNDCDGHGTHVAGTVGGTQYGVAKNVNLVGVRVLNCAGSGSSAGVIAGMDWVRNNHDFNNGPAVVNMSLGGGSNSATNTAVKNLHDAGILVVVAAGNNSGESCNRSPAGADDAFTVGSTTITDQMSSFSNFGSCNNIFAPGSSITSAWINGNTATNTISGTSMASPHVAGAAAVLLGNDSTLTPTQVGDALKASSTQGKISGIPSGTTEDFLYMPPSPTMLLSCTPISHTANIGQVSNPQSVCTITSVLNYAAASVAFSCSGLSGTGISCGFSPASVALTGGGTAATTLTMTVAANASGGNFAVEADDGSLTVSTGMSVEMVCLNANIAAYDSGYGTPACSSLGTSCDTADLVIRRGTISADEPNLSNTLDNCVDGNLGSYENDESLERIVVESAAGGCGELREGDTATIKAHVHAWSSGTSDHADFYYTDNANANPVVWVPIGSITCSQGGHHVLEQTYTIPPSGSGSGGMQAVRVGFRYNGSEGACASGGYNDRDDVVFKVQPEQVLPTSAPSEMPSASPSKSSAPSEAPSAEPTTDCIVVDFESGGLNQWTNVAGLSTCNTGTFIVGTPTQVINGGVTTQVGGDNTSGSGNALFTATNTAAGTNDVDGGVCVVESPAYPYKSKQPVSIAYFFGQRDAGDDQDGDYFLLEYSTDDGSSWTTWESFGDVRNNAAWTELSDEIDPGTDETIIFRVHASDGAGPGDLVEAGIDDLKIGSCP